MFGLFKKKREPSGPDFSAIDSREKVAELVRRGDLEKLLLLPEAFGGEDIEPNTVYVPVGIAEIKSDTDLNVILPLANDGKLTRYVAEPKYSGRSHVPVAIEIAATDPGDFRFSVRIWGESLKGEP